MISFTECTHIHMDDETFSEADLKKVGAYKYAAHKSTDILVKSYAIDNGDIKHWLPGDEYPFAKYHDRLGDDVFLLCWNSGFERNIWWRVLCEKYGWPKPPLEAFVCVAAWARSTASAPAKLEMAPQFFGLKQRKDMAGHRLMLQMCRPATDAQQLKCINSYEADIGQNIDGWSVAEHAKRCHHTPENLRRLYPYCDDDVRSERGIANILPEWDWPEIEAFWESERINDRGIIVDIDFAEAATEYAEEEKIELAEELAEVTGGAVTSPRQFQRFKDWALPRMSDEAIEIAEWYDKGELKYSFDADVRDNLIQAALDDPNFLDEDVFDALEILDEAGKSAISKYDAIKNRATTRCGDGLWRVHGLYMFAGAAQSGRHSSVGLQAHNLVRDVPEKAAEMIEAFVDRDRHRVMKLVKDWAANYKGTRKVRPSPIHVLGTLLRPTITGDPGGDVDLIWGDWSSVEAVLLPWLSLDPDAEDTLERARRGEDIYLPDASAILGRKVAPTEKFIRQAYGKVPRLSLGYMGGAGALAAMAKNYGVFFPKTEREDIVKNWRAANPWAGRFAKAVEKAALTAMDYPDRSYSAGRLEYIYHPGDLGGLGALYCILPSGRPICYPDPHVETIHKPWGPVTCITARKGSWKPKKGSTVWPRVALWRGLLVENATQAAQADLLNVAIVRAQKRRWRLDICAHTHDEIIAETCWPEEDAAILLDLMQTQPGWPGDDALPLRAEVEKGYRYKVKFQEAA